MATLHINVDVIFPTEYVPQIITELEANLSSLEELSDVAVYLSGPLDNPIEFYVEDPAGEDLKYGVKKEMAASVVTVQFTHSDKYFLSYQDMVSNIEYYITENIHEVSDIKTKDFDSKYFLSISMANAHLD